MLILRIQFFFVKKFWTSIFIRLRYWLLVRGSYLSGKGSLLYFPEFSRFSLRTYVDLCWSQQLNKSSIRLMYFGGGGGLNQHISMFRMNRVQGIHYEMIHLNFARMTCSFSREILFIFICASQIQSKTAPNVKMVKRQTKKNSKTKTLWYEVQ